jgi:hypothetical protein
MRRLSKERNSEWHLSVNIVNWCILLDEGAGYYEKLDALSFETKCIKKLLESLL